MSVLLTGLDLYLDGLTDVQLAAIIGRWKRALRWYSAAPGNWGYAADSVARALLGAYRRAGNT